MKTIAELVRAANPRQARLADAGVILKMNKQSVVALCNVTMYNDSMLQHNHLEEQSWPQQ